jgi:hypothetical protein
MQDAIYTTATQIQLRLVVIFRLHDIEPYPTKADRGAVNSSMT